MTKIVLAIEKGQSSIVQIPTGTEVEIRDYDVPEERHDLFEIEGDVCEDGEDGEPCMECEICDNEHSIPEDYATDDAGTPYRKSIISSTFVLNSASNVPIISVD